MNFDILIQIPPILMALCMTIKCDIIANEKISHISCSQILIALQKGVLHFLHFM